MDIRSLITRLGYKVDTSGLKKGERAVGNYARNVKRLAIGALAAIAAATLGVVGASVSAAAEMESMNAAFEVMLGSADKAQKLMSDIIEMSDFTPFQSKDLAKSAKTLLNFGVAAKDIMPNLNMLGDVAGDDTERLRMLTLAFGQMSQAGQLMGQDLLQFINAGFSPLQEIARKTGRNIKDLKKDMSKGLISSQMVVDAFSSATSKGGRFFGNMKKQSQTMKGLWSTFLGMVTRLRVLIGNKLQPVISKILNLTNAWLIKTAIPATKAWLDSLDPLLWFFEDMIFILKLIPGIVKEIGAAFKPEIENIKAVGSEIKSLATEVWDFVAALLGTESAGSVIKALFDGIGNALKIVVGLLKHAAAGYKMLTALIKDDDTAMAEANRSAHEAEQLIASVFSPDVAGPGTGDRAQQLGKNLVEGMSKNLGQLDLMRQMRREKHIQNINNKTTINQKNTINAPAAKDGTTGLSARGIDASLRKAQTSLWAAQLNKLTTAAIGS